LQKLESTRSLSQYGRTRSPRCRRGCSPVHGRRTKSRSFSIKTFSEPHNASSKVKNAARQLQQLIEHVDIIRTDIQHLAASNSATFLSDDRADFITALLGDCAEEASELNDIVKKLAPAPNDGRLKISLKAIVSVKKEKDILERCASLEKLKSRLGLWFGHGGLVLLQGSSTLDN
jgi:hypothetical protein